MSTRYLDLDYKRLKFRHKTTLISRVTSIKIFDFQVASLRYATVSRQASWLLARALTVYLNSLLSSLFFFVLCSPFNQARETSGAFIAKLADCQLRPGLPAHSKEYFMHRRTTGVIVQGNYRPLYYRCCRQTRLKQRESFSLLPSPFGLFPGARTL